MRQFPARGADRPVGGALLLIDLIILSSYDALQNWTFSMIGQGIAQHKILAKLGAGAGGMVVRYFERSRVQELV